MVDGLNGNLSMSNLREQKIYHPNGHISQHCYFNDDNGYHNENGPAIIKYFDNSLKSDEYYYLNDKLHYDSQGRTQISYYKSGVIAKETYYNGAYIYKKIVYHKNSSIAEIGTYDEDGRLHCNNGPALIIMDENSNMTHTRFAKNGRSHCIDGPAWVTWVDKDNAYKDYYYIDGKCITEKMFKKRTDPVYAAQVVINKIRYNIIKISHEGEFVTLQKAKS